MVTVPRVIPRILGRKSVPSGTEKRDMETSSSIIPEKTKLSNLHPGDFFLCMMPSRGWGNINLRLATNWNKSVETPVVHDCRCACELRDVFYESHTMSF